MTKDEKSLLLYLETCAVDLAGAVDQRRMNDEDRVILERWTSEGFVQSGRIEMSGTKAGATWVRLSEEAWNLAHALRRERAERMWSNRTWRTTEEKRAASDG